ARIKALGGKHVRDALNPDGRSRPLGHPSPLPKATVGLLGSLNWPPRLLTGRGLVSSVPRLAPIRTRITAILYLGNMPWNRSVRQESLSERSRRRQIARPLARRPSTAISTRSRILSTERIRLCSVVCGRSRKRK